MITRLAYDCYKHTIRSAYNSLGLLADVSDGNLGLARFDELASCQRDVVLERCFENIRKRLGKVAPNAMSELLDQPKFREMNFLNREIHIPLLNKQAVEWYGEASIYNFDCIVETFAGLHKNARTIYDVGGHQGVWAAYYSLIVGDQGRVYTFEPSIMNIECSSLLFLLNGIDNVINIPFGIGDKTGIVKKQESGALVDFIDHNIGFLRFDQIFWDRADFIKIDIEGFEYEFLKSFSRLFDFCERVHLELHIPHLVKRDLDYREIYGLIPFDKVRVVNYQHTQLREVGPNDSLDGFCSLLISPK